MASKLKHYIFPFIILTLALVFLITNYLFFTIHYTRHLQAEFKNMTTYLRDLRTREWLDIDIDITSDNRFKTAFVEMDRIAEEYQHSTANEKNAGNPEWYEIVAREFRDESFNVGLVNTNGLRTKAKTVRVDFDRASEGVRWAHMAPERIEWNSTCPDIPMPRFEDYKDLDVVVASVEGGCGSRDVFRLQVNLVVANLLFRSGRRGGLPVYAVFVGSCEPMWEVFRCDDLLWNEGNSWIYKPDLARIQKVILMPFGPCQFVPPFSKFGYRDLWRKLNHTTTTIQTSRPPHPKEAFVTVLHSSEDYVCGAIVLAQSILRSNTTKDLILLADDNISPQSIEALRASGWKTKRIERIRSPYSKENTYNEWNYSKLRIWQLTKYEKLMFIDADLIVNKNMDEFFAYPQLTAAGNYKKHLFNSGLMLVEPSRCSFETLMEKMEVVESYNGGDQGFLNEMFAWWHRLPAQTNYLKVFVDANDHLHWVSGKEVYAVHYTGLKPWKCGDEARDCNWDEAEFHRYASSSAHRMWWNVHRSLPENLKAYCSLYRVKNDTYSPSNIGL